MKLLVFSQYYYPERFLITEICEELVKKGNEVTVICGIPNYPHGKYYNGYGIFKKRHEIINGVDVNRVIQFSRGKNIVMLMLNYLSYAVFASLKGRHIKGEYDAIFCYQLTPILQAFPAIRAKRKRKIPLILYCLDLAPLSGSTKLKRNGWAYRLYHLISIRSYQNCDKIAVTSKNFINYLHTVNGISKEKCVYIPQHADEKLCSMDLSAQDNGIMDFMFAGNVGLGQKIEYLVTASQILVKRGYTNFKIHILGDGSDLDYIKKLVMALGVDDYWVFYGSHPFAEMPNYFKLADVLIVSLRKGNITLPGKLQAYMTTGKPIIAALEGSGADIIHEAACGSVVEPENEEALANIMIDYIEHPEKYKMMGENGKKYFTENFTKALFLKRMSCVFGGQ